MAIMQIIHVIAVPDAGVFAVRPVLVRVGLMLFVVAVGHGPFRLGWGNKALV